MRIRTYRRAAKTIRAMEVVSHSATSSAGARLTSPSGGASIDDIIAGNWSRLDEVDRNDCVRSDVQTSVGTIGYMKKLNEPIQYQ